MYFDLIRQYLTYVVLWYYCTVLYCTVLYCTVLNKFSIIPDIWMLVGPCLISSIPIFSKLFPKNSEIENNFNIILWLMLYFLVEQGHTKQNIVNTKSLILLMMRLHFHFLCPPIPHPFPYLNPFHDWDGGRGVNKFC